MLNTKKIKSGVYFHSMVDKKFKFNRISVNFVVKMNSKEVSSNALLSFLLRKRCQQYSNMLDLGKKLQQLYGANLFSGCKKIGDNQVITFGISSLDDEISLNGEDLNKQVAKLLDCIIFEPIIESGKFVEEDLTIEKQNLIELVESEYNDKKLYALNQAMYHLFDGEGYGCNKYGDVESIRAIQNSKLMDAYRKMLTSAEIHIMFVGREKYSDCFDVFKNRFDSIDRDDIYVSESKKYIKLTEAKHKVEYDQVLQSKLVMGFASSKQYDFELDEVIMVMAALLGGTPMSKLFVNVREKMSLCYYCSARYDRFKGLIWIESGVENKNIEKAKVAILEQFEEIKSGKFSDDDLNKVIIFFEDKLKSVFDSPSGIENHYLSELCGNHVRSIDDVIDKIKHIKKQDIIQVANLYSLVIDYVITSEG